MLLMVKSTCPKRSMIACPLTLDMLRKEPVIRASDCRGWRRSWLAAARNRDFAMFAVPLALLRPRVPMRCPCDRKCW